MNTTRRRQAMSKLQRAQRSPSQVATVDRSWVVVVVVVVALASIVAGCTGQPQDTPTGLTDPDAPWPPVDGTSTSEAVPSTGAAPSPSQDSSNKNRTLWAMPLDEFRPVLDQLDSYGENLLTRDCIEAAGYEWPVPWLDVDAMEAGNETWNAVGRRLFTVEIAQKWGYHTASRQSANDVAWREFGQFVARYNGDEAFGAVNRSCLEEARRQIPAPSPETTNYATEFAARAHQEALLDPAVVEAAGRWRECMAPQGLGDLPDAPEGLPTDDMAERFKVGEPGTTASAEEIRIAVADAECMESSGYSQALYDVEWELQARAVEQNREALDRVRDELQARRQAMLEVIAQHAPQP